MKTLTNREKWFGLLKGEDVGAMVSPLCCEWKLDGQYKWPGPGEPPFGRTELNWQTSEQIAVARATGWDQRFIAYLPFTPVNSQARSVDTVTPIDGGTRTERRIHTPYGDLTSIEEKEKSSHMVKEWLETKEDFHRATWVTQQEIAFDKDPAIAEGKRLRAAIGDLGPLGIYWGPPLISFLNKPQMYYHMFELPEEFAELHAASTESNISKLEAIREAGMDFLFFCVDGTDWISPQVFETYYVKNTETIFKKWHDMGGFIVWHSCGHVKVLIEQGFYNRLKPDVFETISEPPVGDVPGLAWARKILDPGIVTMGNIPLPVMLFGTEGDVRKEVRKVKEQTMGYRHIVGLTDDVLLGTPLKNALALVDEARKK